MRKEMCDFVSTDGVCEILTDLLPPLGSRCPDAQLGS